MSYHTPDLSEARRELIRRANRWGGTWVIVPHPSIPGEYGVGLKGIPAGDPVEEHTGPTLDDICREAEPTARRILDEKRRDDYHDRVHLR